MSEPRLAFVAGVATGGTARHVAMLAAGCRDAGLEVAVLAPAVTLAAVRDFGLDDSRAQSGRDDAEAMELAEAAIGERPRPVRDVMTVVALRTQLTARAVDVVHAHGVRAGAFAALAIGRPGGRRRAVRPKLIVTVHNAPPQGRAARVVAGVLERWCARRADLVLAASADLADRMHGLGADVQEFDVPAAPLATPSAREIAAARADIAAEGRPIVLTVARLAPQKGLDVLVDAAARLAGRDPRPRTVIAGAGPLADTLASKVRQSGADVTFLGARRDVAALLAVADVVVVPSHWEARALILQEALRAGRPVVATSAGGTPELTGADGALLVPPGEPAALAAAITRVLDDPQLTGRLSAAARRRSASFPGVTEAIATALSIYRRISPDHS